MEIAGTVAGMDLAPEQVRIGRPPVAPRGPAIGGRIAVVAALLLAVGLGAAAFALWPGSGVLVSANGPIDSPLVAAQKTCSLPTAYAAVGDGGKTMTVQTVSEKTPTAGITYGQLECLWRALKVSDAVKSQMESTRALDGRQSGDWPGFHATWTYHPDHGLQLIVTAA